MRGDLYFFCQMQRFRKACLSGQFHKPLEII